MGVDVVKPQNRGNKMNKRQGFTTIELISAMAIACGLTVAAVGGYTWYLPKAQSEEADQLIKAQLWELSGQSKAHYCSSGGAPITTEGKYGKLVLTPGNSVVTGASCPSGCTLVYTYNATGVSKTLAGKHIDVDVLNNLKVSKKASTNVDARFLPHGLATLSPLPGDACPTVALTDPTATNGNVTGSETGDSDPTPVTPPATGGGGGGTTTTPPTTGGTGGTGSGGTTTPTEVPPSPPVLTGEFASASAQCGGTYGMSGASIGAIKFFSGATSTSAVTSMFGINPYVTVQVSNVSAGTYVNICNTGWNPWPLGSQVAGCSLSPIESGSAIANVNKGGFKDVMGYTGDRLSFFFPTATTGTETLKFRAICKGFYGYYTGSKLNEGMKSQAHFTIYVNGTFAAQNYVELKEM